MIKFFRKIRRNLLSEDKTLKYFKYAFGEIILVVIGILIALQINNWNEDRIKNFNNEIILENLNSEYSENLVALSNDIVRLTSAINGLDSLLTIMGQQEIQINQVQFELLLETTFTTPTWSPSSFVLEELKNSGGLTQLNNNLLKKLLFKWERDFSKLSSTEESFNRYSRQYIEFLTKYGSARNLDAISGNIEKLEKSIIAKNHLSFLTNPEFENRVDNFYFLAYSLRDDYMEISELMREIIKATKRDELKK